MSKTELWDRLGKTDPKHTKSFQRSGGFKGTAIKPMFSYRRMTEEFGPCGQGWGINEPSFQVVHAEGEILVYCTVSIWHGTKENVVFGVGGDKCLAKFSSGAKTDDEAFKKSFTDAVTNALKLIGVGADIHMGMFDDSKYVNALKAEFTEPKRENPHVTRAADIVPAPDYDPSTGEVIDNVPHAEATQKLRVVDQKPIFEALSKELYAHKDPAKCLAWLNSERVIETVANFKAEWQGIFRGLCKEHLALLRENPNYLMAGA
jgi:hypothetical protein